MKKEQIQDIIIYTLFPYIILGVFSYLLWIQDKIIGYFPYIFIGMIALLFKDILVYFVEIKEVYIERLDRGALKKKFTFLEKIIVYNRIYVFPAMLILYLGILLYTSLWNEQGIGQEIQNILLGGAIVTGIFTIFKEDIEKQYIVEQTNDIMKYLYVFLIYFLSILGAYLVLRQTMSLGILGYIISLLVAVIIFLLGFTILEKEET